MTDPILTTDPQHRRLREAVVSRLDRSRRRMKDRYGAWNDADALFRCYVDKTKKDSDGKAQSPYARDIVIPYSYAVQQIYLTYLMAVYTAKEPTFPVQGYGPEDSASAEAAEHVLAYQMDRMTGNLMLYAFIQDVLRYGLGVLKVTWDEQDSTVVTRTPVPTLLQPFMGKERVKREKVITYAGNLLTPIDPFAYFPDPGVPQGQIDRAEFIGHRVTRNLSEIRQRARDGVYWQENVEKIQPWTMADGGEDEEPRRDSYLKMSGVDQTPADDLDRGSVKLDELNVKLVPKEWGLGDSEDLEAWWLTLANRDVLIRAEPSIYQHGKLNYVVGTFGYDPHAFLTDSLSGLIDGLQAATSWLYNCYDSETEILTERGFSTFADLVASDRVATVDPQTSRMWYETPREIMHYPYDGEMVSIRSNRVDLCVTPNHDLWSSTRHNGKEAYHPYGFLKAEALSGESRMQVAVTPQDESDTDQWARASMTFEEEPPLRDRGSPKKYPEATVPLRVFAPFLGYFLAEGSTSKGQASGTYVVGFAQKHGEIADEMEAVFSQMPFHACRYESLSDGCTRWSFADRRLYRWLEEHCGKGAASKRIPACVWEWPTALRMAVLEAALAGDGNLDRGGTTWGYTTISRQLADDIQRLALSVGWHAMFSTATRATSMGNTIYRVRLHPKRQHVTVSPRNISRVSYRGMVHCVENSTHLIVVRRNGRVVICGQSRMQSVRSTMNPTMFIDPSIFEMEDLENPEPGGYIRLKPEYYGHPNAIKQGHTPLQFTDPTARHFEDMAYHREMIQFITAATDPQAGVETQTRRTLGEVQNILLQSGRRLQLLASQLAAQAIRPLGRMMLQHTQQLLQEPVWTRILGSASTELMERAQGGLLQVSPYDLQGMFDLKIQDGTLPPDPSRFAEVWKEIFVSLTQNPMILQAFQAQGKQFRMDMLFKHVVETMGVRNFEQFFEPGVPQVQPDQRVMDQVQAGNYVPQGAGTQGAPAGTVYPSAPMEPDPAMMMNGGGVQ